MAFIGILPHIPSWKEKLADNLGKGISQGVQTATNMLVDRYTQKKQAEELRGYFGNLKEQHPGDKTYEMLSDIASSPLPNDQKSQFVRALLGHRENPYLGKQQDRLDRDSMTKLYNQKIREIDEDLKYGDYSVDKDSLRSQKQQLQQQRDTLFSGLNNYGNNNDYNSSFTEDDEDEIPVKRKKVRFDPKNVEHRKKYEFLKKRHGNNKALIDKILSREFE